MRAAREIGLRALTLYAFSAQNWQRPADEVATLMQLLRDYVIEERAEIMESDIRLITIGDVARLPAFVREPLDALIASRRARTAAMTLCLALSYGGRESIVARGARAGARGRRGRAATRRRSPRRDFSARAADGRLPQLDLLIRTSGEQRLSNFLLWEAAYAELYFTDMLWPDFGRDDLRRRWRPTAAASAASAASPSRSPSRLLFCRLGSVVDGRRDEDGGRRALRTIDHLGP